LLPVRNLLFPILIVAGLPAYAQNSRVVFERLTPALIQQRLEAVTLKLKDRRATLEALFREAGCDGDNLTTQKVSGSSQPNILCTLPAAEPDAGAVVVGGHYDKVDAGMGAVDDWSGAVLLPSLYQSLKGQPRRYRYVFIAFTAKEAGLIGSTEYVHKLSKPDRANIRAMINLECLGLTPPKVWSSRADKRLLAAYAKVAASLGIEVAGSNADRVGDDDSHPFLNARIPVLSIHSVTTQTLPILHSERDKVTAIHAEDYYAAYRLAAAYLAYLDMSLEPRAIE
jgi:nucleotide-binding universal stress UspA family protein